MSTLKQIEANRLNSQKSTGPRSPEGKTAVRFNALKSGIDAKSQVIPGEDPAALELLATEYHERFQPATPEARALVDALVTAEWLQRRFRTLETQLYAYGIQTVFRQVEGFQIAQAYDHHSDAFSRLQRRIDAAERTFHRTLLALQKLQPRAPQPNQPSEPEPLSNQPPAPEIGFVPSTPPQASPTVPFPAGRRAPASSTPFVVT